MAEALVVQAALLPRFVLYELHSSLVLVFQLLLHIFDPVVDLLEVIVLQLPSALNLGHIVVFVALVQHLVSLVRLLQH